MNQPKFWIGCFNQPVESFAKWAAEGVNLCVQSSQSNNNTAQQRRKAAADHGMFYIDVPDGNTPQDLMSDALSMASDPACYAVCLSDEPSENQPWYTTPESATFVAAFLAKWKPVFDAVKGKKIIWANFGGNRIISGRPWYMGQMVLPYTQGCNVTEVCFDSYPINAGTWAVFNAQKTNDYNGGKDPLLIPGETEQQFTCRVLQSFCVGLPTWAYLETTKINPGGAGRSPTGAEIQFQADSLIKLGVKGLVYFSHCFGQGLPWDVSAPAGGSAWDGRGPDQVAACKALAIKMNGSGIPPIPDLSALASRVVALEQGLASLKASAIIDISLKRS